MTKKEFTEACLEQCAGVIKMAAENACYLGEHNLFVQHMLEQDSDEGSRSGTKRVLGEELYAELQKFKTEPYGHDDANKSADDVAWPK